MDNHESAMHGMSGQDSAGRRSVLVITLDGASWDGLEPWLASGKMPTLARLVATGASGELRTVMPTLVYPNWATFWTGQKPSQHMIYAFRPPPYNGGDEQLLDSRNLKVPSWLELTANSGRRVMSLFAQLTYPPIPLNGTIVSELHAREAKDFIHPPSLYDDLVARFGDFHVPKSEQYFPKGGFRTPADVETFIKKQIESIEQTTELAKELFDREPYGASVVHLFATDPLQHALWHGIDRTHPAFDEKIHAQVGEFFAALDTAIDKLIHEAKTSAVLVCSSHGFTTCRKVVNLVRCLKDGGVIRPLAGVRRTIRRVLWSRIRGIRRVRNVLAGLSSALHEIVLGPAWIPLNLLVDFKAIYIRRSSTGKELIKTVVQALEKVRDPDTGQRVIKKAWRASELYGPLAIPDMEVLVPEFELGYTCRTGTMDSPPFVTYQPNRDYLISTHTVRGLWVFAGEGALSVQCEAGMEALAPTLLSYLDLPIPHSMESKPLPIFKASSRSAGDPASSR